jgi:hypothetical protein
VLNIVGTIALLKVAGEFSAVTAVLTAFMRKFSSLIFSYMLYPKPFNIGHSMGLLLVFGAVGMHAHHKQHKKATGHNEVNGAALGAKTLHGAEKATDEEMGGLMIQRDGTGTEHNTRPGFAVAPPSPQRAAPPSQTPPSPVLRTAAHPLIAPIRSG